MIVILCIQAVYAATASPCIGSSLFLLLLFRCQHVVASRGDPLWPRVPIAVPIQAPDRGAGLTIDVFLEMVLNIHTLVAVQIFSGWPGELYPNSTSPDHSPNIAQVRASS